MRHGVQLLASRIAVAIIVGISIIGIVGNIVIIVVKIMITTIIMVIIIGLLPLW